MSDSAAVWHFGVVRTAGRDIAIASSELVEAVDMPEQLMPMPEASALMAGMFLLRGRLIPVLDLQRLMAPAAGGGAGPSGVPAPAPVRRQVAVVAQGGKRLGIGVDAIAGVLRVAPSAVTGLGGTQGGLFDRWVVQDDGRALPVLQVSALLGHTPGVMPAVESTATPGLAAPSVATAVRAPRRHTLAALRSRVLAFDFAAVPDVLPMPAVRPFFAASGALRGMVPWRGTELLLVDLPALLGMDDGAVPADAGAQKPLLVVLQHGERRIGVQVDALLGMESAGADATVPLSEGASLEPACYAGAMRTAAHGIGMVLRVPALLEHPLVASFLDSLPPAARSVEARSGAAGQRTTYLVYQAGGACATPLTEVEEILAYGTPAVRIDTAAGGMCGLVERHGRPLEVFDLRTLLGRSAAVPTAQARVLVVRRDGRLRGFLVDHLVSLVTADATAQIGRAAAPAGSGAGAGSAGTAGRSGIGLGRLLALRQGAEALTCQQVELRSLMEPPAEAPAPPSAQALQV